MEKYKKANEWRNNLSFGKKLANIPLRGLVGDPLCKQKTRFGKPKWLPRRKSLEKLDENIKKRKKQQNLGEKYFENHSNFMSAITMKLLRVWLVMS